MARWTGEIGPSAWLQGGWSWPGQGRGGHKINNAESWERFTVHRRAALENATKSYSTLQGPSWPNVHAEDWAQQMEQTTRAQPRGLSHHRLLVGL